MPQRSQAAASAAAPPPDAVPRNDELGGPSRGRETRPGDSEPVDIDASEQGAGLATVSAPVERLGADARAPEAPDDVDERLEENTETATAFERDMHTIRCETDRLFAWILPVEWVAALVFTLWASPTLWSGGSISNVGLASAALGLGGLFTLAPAVLARYRPGRRTTRHAVALGQMAFAALVIHLLAGRLEAHFLIFSSLAILAFYRDAQVLYIALASVAADHFLRGVLWPESIYGIAEPSAWRWLEHTSWAGLEAAFLIGACKRSEREMTGIAHRHVKLMRLQGDTSDLVGRRTEELAAARLRLIAAAKLELAGQLAAGVAHEVRNPLGIILAGLNYLEQEDVFRAPDVRQLLGDMEDAVIRADAIVRELLDLARPEELSLHPGLLDCEIRACLHLLRAKLEETHVRVALDLPDDLPSVAMDASKLHQVFLNLFMNALQAMGPNGGTLSVSTWERHRRRGDPSTGSREGDLFRPGQRTVVVHVDDTGPGLGVEQLTRVFDPFYSTRRGSGGNGLGLSVVHMIVGLHGGTVTIENRDAGGARATLVFPAHDGQPTR